MPFTIGGEWKPEAASLSSNPPVQIIKEKRRGAYVTLILNLSEEKISLKQLCSTLKRRLGCGGSVKEGHIELQGDQIEIVKTHLIEMGIDVKRPNKVK